jgi:hypothetical protein
MAMGEARDTTGHGGTSDLTDAVETTGPLDPEPAP